MSLNDQSLMRSETERKKEKVYIRNFITLCIEAFMFSGAQAIFATDNVFPTYVSNLSDNPLSIALISVLFYGFDYAAYIFSCQIGVKAKSPKWISFWICLLQRVGFVFILVSTYTAEHSAQGALTIFYVSLAFYSISAGLSSPMFQQMVSVSIFKNISSFYGTYMVFGSAGGVVGSLLYTRFLKNYVFPMSYRYTFMVGLIMALIGSAVIAVGIREVTDDRVVENISFGDIFRISKDILKNNERFRTFTIIRVISAAADFALPYYILTVLDKSGVPDGYAGTLAIISLATKMIASLFLGKIGDRFNPFAIIFVCMSCGAIASLLAVVSDNWQLSTLMYIILAVATDGTFIATSAAIVAYSGGKMIPVYSSAISVLCAPVYLAVSFVGAKIAERISTNAMFVLTLIVYAVCSLSALRYGTKYLKEDHGK